MFLSFSEIICICAPELPCLVLTQRTHCIDSLPVIILLASIKSPLLLLFSSVLAHTLLTFPHNFNTYSPKSFLWLFLALMHMRKRNQELSYEMGGKVFKVSEE